MNTLSYSAFEANIASTFDRVNDDHVPILVTRPNGKPAVIVSLEDFQVSKETTTKKSLTPYELGKDGFGSDETHEGDIAQNSKAFLKARFKNADC